MDCAGCADEQQDEAGIRAVAVLRRRFALVDCGDDRSKPNWMESGELVSWNVCDRETMELLFRVKCSFLILSLIPHRGDTWLENILSLCELHNAV